MISIPGCCCLVVMVWKCVAAHVGTILPTVLDWGPLSNNSPSSESACLQIDSPWLAPPPTPRTRAHCPPPQCAWYSVLDTSPFRVCTVLYCTVLHCTVLYWTLMTADISIQSGHWAWVETCADLPPLNITTQLHIALCINRLTLQIYIMDKLRLEWTLRQPALP